MKKVLAVLVFAMVAMAGFAQDETPVKKYSVATNSFWSNWFVEVGADWNAWYSNEEHGQNLSTSPFKKFRSNPGAAIAVGKWFTPGLGLRTKVQGIWGKTVTDANNYGNHNSYWVATEQAMFNLSNMFCGYNPNRVWNLIPFAGAGVTRSMTYDRYGMTLTAGIQSSWKLSNTVRIYAEGGYNFMEADADGVTTNFKENNRCWDSHDNKFYAEVGLTFNLGKTKGWKAVPDVDALKANYQSQLDALQNQLNDANAENERLKNALANQKPAEVSKEIVATPVSVFFGCGKSKEVAEKDIVNLRPLVDYAKDNGKSLSVKGYADSATGSAAINQKLAKERAETVANKIVELGLDSSKVSTDSFGGVSDLSPIALNRRAVVQVAE